MPLSDRTTIATLRIMKFLLEHHDEGAPVFGTEIMEALGLPSGTIYPVLKRFEGFGWIIGQKETVPPSVLRRPRRINYIFTPAGVSAVRSELKEARDLLAEEES